MQRLAPTFKAVRRWLVRNGLLETAVLAALLTIAVSLWGFLELADEVREGESRGFDEWVLRAFRQPENLAVPRGPDWLLQVARDLTALGGIAVLSLVSWVTLAFLALRGKWGSFWLMFGSVLGGGALNGVLKEFFQRARPDIVPHLTLVSSHSFPSGHSMLSAATYLAIGALLARTTTDRTDKIFFLGVAAALTLCVGVTRVYLGVHFPTDVLAGWCAGIAWALFCAIVARRLQQTGVVEPENGAPPPPSQP